MIYAEAAIKDMGTPASTFRWARVWFRRRLLRLFHEEARVIIITCFNRWHFRHYSWRNGIFWYLILCRSKPPLSLWAYRGHMSISLSRPGVRRMRNKQTKSSIDDDWSRYFSRRQRCWKADMVILFYATMQLLAVAAVKCRRALSIVYYAIDRHRWSPEHYRRAKRHLSPGSSALLYGTVARTHSTKYNHRPKVIPPDTAAKVFHGYRIKVKMMAITPNILIWNVMADIAFIITDATQCHQKSLLYVTLTNTWHYILEYLILLIIVPVPSN